MNRRTKHIARQSRRLWLSLVSLIVMLIASISQSYAEHPEYHLYLDADMTNNPLSGQAIELGIRAALHEVDNKINGIPTRLIIKDHHGSTPRSQFHIEQILEDKHTLAMFGGMHSPPLLASRDTINRQQLLTLVPWAAATPITRPDTNENWIFRLSLDDSKAGEVIIDDLVSQADKVRPFLLLEDTGWGRANKATMTQRLEQLGLKALGIHFFQWGIGHFEARAILENAVKRGADSFVLVANAPESLVFMQAMLSMDTSMYRPIRSHWGITGGDFAEQIGLSHLNRLDLKFIQTSFSFFSEPQSTIATQALQSAAKVKQQNQLSAADIKAPAGFIHAYDLTKLFLAAAKTATLTGNGPADASLIKDQLESLSTPIDGLLKTYIKPFSLYTNSARDAHEALNKDDFTMAYFDAQGNIRLQEIKQ